MYYAIYGRFLTRLTSFLTSKSAKTVLLTFNNNKTFIINVNNNNVLSLRIRKFFNTSLVSFSVP